MTVRIQSAWKLFTLGLAALLLAAPGRVVAQMKIELTDGEATVNSTVAKTDPDDPVRNHPAKTFTVEFKAGETYQIDMKRPAKGKAIDPYLRLEDPAGKEVASNDDGGEGLNAKITYQAPAAGKYTIIATTFGGGTGPFTLVVKNLGKVKGDVAKLELNNGAALVKAKLDRTDALDKVQEGCRCKVFTIALKANTKYQIDMKSKQFDAYLRIEDAQGKNLDEDDDGGDDLDAQLTFDCPAAGTYRIIATSFEPRLGEFTLQVKELPK